MEVATKAYKPIKTGANGNVLMFDANGNPVRAGSTPEVDTALVATKTLDAEAKLTQINNSRIVS